MVSKVWLLQLVVDGLRPPKEVVGLRATASEVLPYPRPREMVSFTDLHERGFEIPASDFLWGFLQEHGVQMQNLPNNGVLQLAGFVVACEAFLGIEPNKDLF